MCAMCGEGWTVRPVGTGCGSKMLAISVDGFHACERCLRANRELNLEARRRLQAHQDARPPEKRKPMSEYVLPPVPP